MVSSVFEQFTEAVAERSRADTPSLAREYSRVAVLGGGADARLLAALCLAEGAEVSLFSAYGAELSALRAGTVGIRGDGPVGNYQVDQSGVPAIQTTGELDQAVSDAEVLFLTGPVHKQRTYAMVLADHLRDGQVLVLAPGRSFGAAEVAWLLRVGGCAADYTIVEAQGLPYWHSVDGATMALSAAAPVPAATLPSHRPEVILGLQRFLPNLQPADNVLISSFAGETKYKMGSEHETES